jgi:hypothetical protein
MISFFVIWILVSIVTLYLVFIAGLLVNYHFQEVKDRPTLIQSIKNISIAVFISMVLWNIFFLITYFSLK